MPRFNLDFMHGGEDEHVPHETTPQGTQEVGVEHGHEPKDVDLGAILKWFAGLGVVVAATLVGLGLVIFAWVHYIEGQRGLPSPVYEVQAPPREPPLLPNPYNYPDGPMQVAGARPQPLARSQGAEGVVPIVPDPAMIGAALRADEDEELEKAKLLLPDGEPLLPPQALSVASKEGTKEKTEGAGPSALVQAMPSDASGGTVWDNRLR